MQKTDLAAPCTAKDIVPEGLHERIDDVIEKVLQLPQAPLPVIHRFSPGLYIREIKMPAGVFAIGHIQKTRHFNVMLKGHVIMVNEDGTTTEYIAPQSYVSDPGRKVGWIVEETVWQNIYPTDETDIDVLESMFLEKTERFLANEEMRKTMRRAEHDADRASYATMLNELGITDADVKAMMKSEEENDIDMPFPVHPYRITESPIEGNGYFLTVGAKQGQLIAPVLFDGKRTPAARCINHSPTPNAAVHFGEDGNLYLVAIKDIDGCMGGSPGTEVTTDYRDTLATIMLSGGEES